MKPHVVGEPSETAQGEQAPLVSSHADVGDGLVDHFGFSIIGGVMARGSRSQINLCTQSVNGICAEAVTGIGGDIEFLFVGELSGFGVSVVIRRGRPAEIGQGGVYSGKVTNVLFFEGIDDERHVGHGSRQASQRSLSRAQSLSLIGRIRTRVKY